jgi:predicted permease
MKGLLRDRAFAVAAILSLALGIGLNAVVFSVTSEFLFSRPTVRDPDTLVSVHVGSSNSVPFREWRFLRDAPVFQELVGMNPMQEVNWRTEESSYRLFVTWVTENYFDVTGVPVAVGRGMGAGELNAVVVSHKFWRSRLGGDPSAVGRTLVLDGKPYNVVGVLPRTHRSLVGFGYMPDLYMTIDRESGYVGLYGRTGGDSRARLFTKLRAAAAELDKIYPDGENRRVNNVLIMSLTGIQRLTETFLRSISLFFALLMLVAGLLLLIACANVASLMLARSSARAQEFAIRMSIGAGRNRLVRQLLAESLLLSSLGAAAGLLLNYVITQALNRLDLPLPFPMQFSIEPDTRLLIYAVSIAIAAALLVGTLPALSSTRWGLAALVRRGEHQVSGRSAYIRSVLISSQIAVSVVVLIIAALSVRNLLQATSVNPGFDLHQTVWMQMRLVPERYGSPPKVRAMAATIVNRIREEPGIESATVAAFVPLNDHFFSRRSTVFTDYLREGKRIEHWWNAIGPDYLRTLSIDLIAGREFTAADREGSQMVVIVNEAFAREAFGSVNAVGKAVRLGTDDRSDRIVVGVARNSKYSNIGERDRAAIYEPYDQVSGGRTSLNFLVKTLGTPRAAVKSLLDTVRVADPSASAEARPMSEATAFALLPSRAGAGILGTIGVLGLTLASVGLYGVLAYSITRRTREIGLRLALGAQSSRVVTLVLREIAWVLGAGLTVGLALAALISKSLVRFLVPGLQPTDTVAYAAVTATLLVVGAVASIAPMVRALRIDPITALRYE